MSYNAIATDLDKDTFQLNAGASLTFFVGLSSTNTWSKLTTGGTTHLDAAIPASAALQLPNNSLLRLAPRIMIRKCNTAARLR